MKRFLLLVGVTVPVLAQMNGVSGERIRAHVKFLSSDLLEGRGPGARGGDLAAEYLATQLALIGAKPAGDQGTYFQNFTLVGVDPQPGFTQQARGLLNMAASAAAVRLERLVGADVGRVGSNAGLTPREQAVLRQASIGQTVEETATALGLGEETVRSHFKKAQAKLGTRNRTHTVVEAMRDLMII